MVILRRGLECSRNHPATACPASWKATVLLSKSLSGSFFSIPAMTLSVAYSNSLIVTFSKFFLAAIIAASLQMFWMSAPLNPGVRADIFLENSLFSILGSVVIFFRCTSKIYYLSAIEGRVISIVLSNLPGLSNALSKISFLLVAAKTMTDVSVVNPSISTSN